jgi:hypothetical protein
MASIFPPVAANSIVARVSRDEDDHRKARTLIANLIWSLDRAAIPTATAASILTSSRPPKLVLRLLKPNQTPRRMLAASQLQRIATAIR